MSIPLIHQIESAERELAERHQPDPGRDHDGSSAVREASAHFLRSTASLGMQLADRLDPTHQPSDAAEVAAPGRDLASRTHR